MRLLTMPNWYVPMFTVHSIDYCQGLTLFCRNLMMRTDNDAQGCTVVRLGEEMLTPSFW